MLMDEFFISKLLFSGQFAIRLFDLSAHEGEQLAADDTQDINNSSEYSPETVRHTPCIQADAGWRYGNC